MWYTVWRVVIFTAVSVSISATEDHAKSRQRRDADSNNSAPHFIIGTILEPPYTMRKIGGSTKLDLEGFIPDLVGALSSSMGFTYEFTLVKDGRYGHCDKTKCSGLLGELVDQEIDIAAAPLTVTANRAKYVDFLWAYKNLGISALVKRRTRGINTGAPYRDNIILRPLKLEVYAVVLAATVMVGLVLWLMNRFNPYEWGGQRQRGLVDEEAGSRFNLSGSLWFVFTSFQWQGYESRPRSLASRILTVFWFVFVTVTLIAYTASFICHIWASTMIPNTHRLSKFSSIKDMVESRTYYYGAVKGGSTEYLLKNVAKGEMYDIMRAKWNRPRGDTMFVDSTAEGIMRVKTHRNYAFFVESSMAKYVVNRNCDLEMIKEVIHPRSHAMAVRSGFKHLGRLNVATMTLLESGKIERLEKKWWNNQGLCNREEEGGEAVKSNKATGHIQPMSVGLDTFWAAVVIIVVGLILSLVTGGAEIIYFKSKGRKSQADGGTEAMGSPNFEKT